MRTFWNLPGALFVALLLTQPLHAAEPKETKRVLIVYSLDKSHPAHIFTEQALNKTLRENGRYNVQVYSEYLDLGRFHDPGQVRAMADFLRRKYNSLPIDVIITVYPDALDFLRSEKHRLFSGIPVVAAEVTRTYAENLDRSPARQHTTATILGDNASGIIAAALRVKPDTKRFALVGGSSPLDVHAEMFIRSALKKNAERLEIIDLTKLSMSETLSRVAILPRDTVVLYGNIIRDGSGQSFIPRDALALVSRAANAPVFGIYDTYLGYGIVGGHLVSFERHGKIAAELALRVMNGVSPGNIPFAGYDAYVDLYDWRELERWNIPVTAIPVKSELRFYVPSFWEKYHWLIIGTLGLIIIETALILSLLINIIRRNRPKRRGAAMTRS